MPSPYPDPNYDGWGSTDPKDDPDYPGVLRVVVSFTGTATHGSSRSRDKLDFRNHRSYFPVAPGFPSAPEVRLAYWKTEVSNLTGPTVHLLYPELEILPTPMVHDLLSGSFAHHRTTVVQTSSNDVAVSAVLRYICFVCKLDLPGFVDPAFLPLLRAYAPALRGSFTYPSGKEVSMSSYVLDLAINGIHDATRR